MSKVNKGKIIDAATRALQKGNIRKAIKEYEKILKNDPQDIRITLKVSDLYARINDNQRARELFEKVAAFYKEQGFLLKALAVYKQIEERLAGDDPKVFIQLSELYEQLGLLNDALKSYKSAAKLYKRNNNTKEWLDTIEKLLELEPENVRVRLRLAEMFSQKGKIREAVKHYKKVAEVLKKAGAKDDFTKVAQRLLYHQPDDFETNKALGEAYLEQGDALNALIRFRACYKSKPQDAEVLDMIAKTFEFLKEPQKAVAILKELARVYAKFGLLREQDEVFSRILKLDPGDTSAKRALRVASLGAVSEEPEVSFDNSNVPIEELEAEELPIDDFDDMEKDSEEPDLPPPANEISESSSTMDLTDKDKTKDTPQPERTLVQNMDDIIKGMAVQKPDSDNPIKFDQIEIVPRQLQGDIKELEFYIDAEMWEEARILLEELEEKAPDLQTIKKFRKMIQEQE